MDEDIQVGNVLSDDDNGSGNLPSMLNVLTILTMIGSGLGFISGIYSYFTVCSTAEKIANQEMPEMGETFTKLMDASIELSIKQCENNLVILLATLLTSALCFLGAFFMRKLKKQGLILYIVGELLGPIVMLVILGTSFGGMMYFGLFIAILFVILYISQRKYLIY